MDELYDRWFANHHERVGPERKSKEDRVSALVETSRILQAHTGTYTVGWNYLSDVSMDAYRHWLRHSIQPLDRSTRTLNHQKSIKTHLATEKDWTNLENDISYVTGIKNQGSCGSCWAFAATAVIESVYAIQTQQNACPLSVQQILDCAISESVLSQYDNGMHATPRACLGGMPYLAYDYLSSHGIESEQNYPYLMTDDHVASCKANRSLISVDTTHNSTTTYVTVPMLDEQALLEAVSHRPVSANIDASGSGFKNYASGIYDAADCSSDGSVINHAIVIVGFGETTDGIKYWKLRNTWGTMWGEQGYMRIIRSSALLPHGPCNLYMYASYPIHLKPGSVNCTRTAPSDMYFATGFMCSLSFRQWGVVAMSSGLVYLLAMVLFIRNERRRE